MTTAMEVPEAPLTSEQQMNVFRLRDKMTLLNAEFLKVLNGFFTEKSHYDFSVTMESYMKHVKELKTMYKVDDDAVAAVNSGRTDVRKTEVKRDDAGEKPHQRKIAKAVRRNGNAGSAVRSTDSPKISKTTVFAASSPAAALSAPKFGDISVIAKDTPAPLSKSSEPPAPAAGTARKRAIRGGGPLGGSESIIFKSGNESQASTSTVTIPTTNIKFPEPSKDFWTKKDSSNGAASGNNDGSLFAFLGKDGDKSKEPSKFTGFSFGKKPESDTAKPDEPKTTVPLFGSTTSAETTVPLFGSTTSKNENVKTTGSLFGAISKSPETTSVGLKSSDTPATTSKPLVFGEQKDGDNAAAKPFSGLAFGASLFGSGAKQTTPSLSFGSGGTNTGSGGTTTTGSLFGGATTTGSLFGGFAGLAQKAQENQAKGEGGDDDEEYVPPKVETVEAEEPDAVISSKVAVFKFADKEYTKLGVGMLHVKDTDGKFSVLIRAATAIGTVWLNALCNKAMKATKVDDKGERIRLTCPVSASEMTTLMIRFGSADVAKKFVEKVEEVSK
ncbi:hypothetical protein L5515_003987 [Caenorhabditis briggsae]|uniref:RanBD1 domain-containing protein n=1 Tax=Caenorhabditis briggsae TaxID=6238 RepID=A0AAE9JBT3_CAEBR|nr:hypothetical protein L5515_003987 [Caenorhabditis briggsae]